MGGLMTFLLITLGFVVVFGIRIVKQYERGVISKNSH